MASMTARQRRDAHQEIVVLQQLEYPNIIRYVEFCEEHPHLYIVMEYADGGDVYNAPQKSQKQRLGSSAVAVVELETVSAVPRRPYGGAGDKPLCADNDGSQIHA
ncbi:hypothetical protein TcYC6_0065580 [Trypanosoma cruzi]|nr:hypothetical protein TcYC6_0065580 [Trypanosoma cruzi]